jgi:hypothetical protein
MGYNNNNTNSDNNSITVRRRKWRVDESLLLSLGRHEEMYRAFVWRPAAAAATATSSATHYQQQ